MSEHEVIIDGKRYRPVDEEEAEDLGDLIARFKLEGSRYWRERFIESDTREDGSRYGMYAEGDENAPFYSEAFLYNLLGKDEARTVLSITRRLCALAGVKFR